MTGKRIFIALIFLLLSIQLFPRDRIALRLPDMGDYIIIKCDFHSHTVFSDGHVWPDFRVGEAWVDGLDALAITDHIEYLPHKDDLAKNHNRSYELARGAANTAGITLVRGAEITKDMPPGHFNAIFLTDADLLDHKDWRRAIKAAHDQGAFIFWNHPGWRGQEKDGIGKWYDEHEELYKTGMMHGIEVVNSDEYYPEVHQWCLDKKLTMMGNSDVHSTTDMDYSQPDAKHRPMTWVLATENSADAIREALDARRTIVYWRDTLIGEQQYLEPLFTGSVILETPTINRKARQQVQLANRSDLVFNMELVSTPEGISAPQHLTLKPGRAVRLNIGFDKEKLFEQIKLDYVVHNLKVTPEQGLPVSWTIRVE